MRVIAFPATIFLLLALGAPPMLAATGAPAPATEGRRVTSIEAAALKRLQLASFDADWAAVTR